ncbi:DUF2358 domain-containing protein [Oscillatoria sp. FACHB-1406]|uniref:DUF2358 domain-containing protein n=1 Tax=Oscillatoria sp. FACHB-1406 TaxID=2692846 RepID=UPI001685D749|nr:DUF2358 domain-containing protein [Oscillatoria sp. FACHB-1406]MBD2579508.1 DUF2358 domain-containing protein [Oscillatoria sp. FACHB-1406]
MDILQILKEDYQRFPYDQTYSLYTPDVYFKDPLNEFKGVEKFKKTIGFMSTWFKNIQMDLHEIERQGNVISTEWTLHWTTPLPWQPRIAIPGRSELTLNENEQIISHIDYWHCSRLDVLKQHFFKTAKK